MPFSPRQPLLNPRLFALLRTLRQGGWPFVRALWRRFADEHFLQASASLAYTTLLSLVPLTAMVVALVAVFPIFSGVVDHIDKFLVSNLLPEKTGNVVAKYIANFSRKASKLTTIGFTLLAVTAWLLLTNLQRTLNRVWRVQETRPVLARLRLYAAVLLVGPLILGAVFGAVSYAVTISLGFVDDPQWLRQALFKLISLLLLTGFFAFLYRAVPNARVEREAALVGGGFAALAFSLMQRAFEFYLVKFPSYTLIYGAFAAVPIFLLWLHLSWVVILLGAILTEMLPAFELPGVRFLRRRLGG